jgi:hypothetical protein
MATRFPLAATKPSTLDKNTDELWAASQVAQVAADNAYDLALAATSQTNGFLKSELSAWAPDAAGLATVVSGGTTPGDGLGGTFVSIVRGALVQDNGTTFDTGAAQYLAKRLVPNGKINVRWYGASGEGHADDSAAISAAIIGCLGLGASGSWRPKIYLPHGLYLMSSGVVIPDTVQVEGDGARSSVIEYHPTTDGTILFDFTAPSSGQIWNAGIRGVGIDGAGNGYQKTAIRLTTCRTFGLENVSINNWQSDETKTGPVYNTAASVGILLRGMESITLRDVTCYADRPMQISVQPWGKATYVDCDHLHCHDVQYYSWRDDEADILVDGDACLTDWEWTGSNALMGGKDGIHWIASDADTNLNYSINLGKIRFEQARVATGYDVHIERYVWNLRMHRLGLNLAVRNGIYVRRAAFVSMRDIQGNGNAHVMFNFDDDSNHRATNIEYNNAMIPTGATVSFGALTQIAAGGIEHGGITSYPSWARYSRPVAYLNMGANLESQYGVPAFRAKGQLADDGYDYQMKCLAYYGGGAQTPEAGVLTISVAGLDGGGIPDGTVEGGVYAISNGIVTKISGTANMVDTDTADKFAVCWYAPSALPVLINRLNKTIKFVYTVVFYG